MNCLVIAAKKYAFTDETTGEIKRGLHVHYLDPLMREDTVIQKGDLTLKVPALDNVFDKLVVLPAFYELDFRQRPDVKGRPVLTLAGVKCLGGVDFSMITEKKDLKAL